MITIIILLAYLGVSHYLYKNSSVNKAGHAVNWMRVIIALLWPATLLVFGAIYLIKPDGIEITHHDEGGPEE